VRKWFELVASTKGGKSWNFYQIEYLTKAMVKVQMHL